MVVIMIQKDQTNNVWVGILCWWKISQTTTCDVQTLVNNKMFYILTGEPVCFHQQFLLTTNKHGENIYIYMYI